MEKYIKDGKVAVLYSPGHGAGWSTWNNGRRWHGRSENLGSVLLYEPAIVKMVEESVPVDQIVSYCEKVYGSLGYYGGAEDLQVVWMELGTEFEVVEYDGSESINYRNHHTWNTA